MNGTPDEGTANKQLVHNMIVQAFNGNLNIISETTSTDFKYENSANAVLPPGAAGYKQVVETLRTAFPDLQLNIENQSSSTSDGKVMTQWTLKGTHDGLLHGFPLNTSLRLAATGRKVAVRGSSIDQVRAESENTRRIVEHWDYIDSLDLLQQLGAIPVSGQDDNRRASANAAVALATQLITLALGVVAVEGAFLTFVVDKRTPDIPFYIAVVLTFLFLFFSMIVGALYVNRLKISLFDSTWNVDDTSKWLFGAQTILGFLGFVAFAVSAATGGALKEDLTQSRISTVERTLDSTRADVAGIKNEVSKLSERIAAVEKDTAQKSIVDRIAADVAGVIGVRDEVPKLSKRITAVEKELGQLRNKRQP